MCGGLTPSAYLCSACDGAMTEALRERERNQLTGRVLPPCRHDDVLLAVQHVGSLEHP